MKAIYIPAHPQRPKERADCAQVRPVTLCLQIEQPGWAPLFVRALDRRGRLSVTFQPSEARRFPAASPSILRRVRLAVAPWAGPCQVSYVPVGP
jgi:hypothetical protein